MTEEKNQVQAKHHQLIPTEEIDRAAESGRPIGYNDLAAHIAAKCKNPYLVPSLVNALKYQTRFGRKDDERKEVEKAIWYLMDLHNRISDVEGEEREYAPWQYQGKLSEQGVNVQGGKWVSIPPEYAIKNGCLNQDFLKEGDKIKMSLKHPHRIVNGKEYIIQDSGLTPSKLCIKDENDKHPISIGIWGVESFEIWTEVPSSSDED